MGEFQVQNMGILMGGSGLYQNHCAKFQVFVNFFRVKFIFTSILAEIIIVKRLIKERNSLTWVRIRGGLAQVIKVARATALKILRRKRFRKPKKIIAPQAQV